MAKRSANPKPKPDVGVTLSSFFKADHVRAIDWYIDFFGERRGAAHTPIWLPAGADASYSPCSTSDVA